MTVEQQTLLTEIFHTVFNQNDIVLREDLTSQDVLGWDSFNHINLIIQIEQVFSISFSTEEVNNFENVGELMHMISEKTGLAQVA